MTPEERLVEINGRADWLAVEIERETIDKRAVRVERSKLITEIVAFRFEQAGSPESDIPQFYPWTQMWVSDAYFALFKGQNRDDLDRLINRDLIEYARSLQL